MVSFLKPSYIIVYINVFPTRLHMCTETDTYVVKINTYRQPSVDELALLLSHSQFLPNLKVD